MSASARERMAVAYPMHGWHKFVSEGFRTRDAHLLEWMGRMLPTGCAIDVQSRPEPFPRRRLAMRGRNAPVLGLIDSGRSVLAVPPLRDRQRWWVHSAARFRVPVDSGRLPAILWNPLIAPRLLEAAPSTRPRTVVLDLLDDWTIHAAFQGIHAHVMRAYGIAFENADVVFANAEGTLELAHRFGRSDAIFEPNGCDPQRFLTDTRATGPITVGYMGKLGHRIDFGLILNTIQDCQDVRFVFCGPLLDEEAKRFVRSLPSNALHVGDVHYEDVPGMLARFDIGWIPHRVGHGEVGGDVIKLYEYRATGLPVLTTPIAGVAARKLEAVSILASWEEHAAWIKSHLEQGVRVARVPQVIPTHMTWEAKARRVLAALGIDETGAGG